MESTPVVTQPASQEFKLTKANVVSLLKGLLIAVVGAALTYSAQFVTKTDFGVYTPIIVTVFALIANTVRLWMNEK